MSGGTGLNGITVQPVAARHQASVTNRARDLAVVRVAYNSALSRGADVACDIHSASAAYCVYPAPATFPNAPRFTHQLLDEKLHPEFWVAKRASCGVIANDAG